jgi:hypothetical protein
VEEDGLWKKEKRYIEFCIDVKICSVHVHEVRKISYKAVETNKLKRESTGVLKASFVLAEIKGETEYEITFTHWNQKQNKKMFIKLSVFEF